MVAIYLCLWPFETSDEQLMSHVDRLIFRSIYFLHLCSKLSTSRSIKLLKLRKLISSRIIAVRMSTCQSVKATPVKTSNGALLQGSYASGKCQGILNIFSVRELSGNFILCQGKMKFCQNVREFYISVLKWKKGRDLQCKVYIVKKDLLFGKIREIQEDFTAACSDLYLNKQKENQL